MHAHPSLAHRLTSTRKTERHCDAHALVLLAVAFSPSNFRSLNFNQFRERLRSVRLYLRLTLTLNKHLLLPSNVIFASAWCYDVIVAIVNLVTLIVVVINDVYLGFSGEAQGSTSRKWRMV